jgi:ATP-binding cassette, subfamily B, bacterial MsbA
MQSSDRALYLRLLRYLQPYWRAFLLAVLGMIGTAATEPVFPAIMKFLLDNGFKTENTTYIWLIPVGIIGLFVARGILSFVTGYLMTWISTRLVFDLRNQLFAKLLLLPTQSFHDQSSGQLISRILYDVDNVNQATTGVLVIAVKESLTALALTVYLLMLDWRLTLITLAIGPVISVLIRQFGKRIRAASRSSFASMRTIAHTIEETVRADKVIKIYGAQQQQSQRFLANSERFRRSMMREAIPASALTPITHITASLAIAIITFVALSQSVGQAGTSAGSFVSFVTTLLLLISPIKQLTTISPVMQRGLAACESVFGLLDSPSEPDPEVGTFGRVIGNLEFRHVHFRYPGAERDALSDISFTVAAGQTVALVGASGGGKTTVGALIPRFYACTEGEILIDGMDISKVSLSSLRNNIALVSQDIVLLNDTIAANIAFGQVTPERSKAIWAARSANAMDFIDALPQGLDTLIGENGAKLSGGQRQRIAIARALYKDTPILILDEATSALDTESERLVQHALGNLMANRTTLVIAHRLSTIEHAHLVLVMDQGKIVESGTHASLLAGGGIYKNLHSMQS